MPRVSPGERLAAAARERVARDAVRRLRTVSRREGARIEIDGRRLLDFSGNDYLGLAANPAAVAALREAAAAHGVGGVASHLVCGHHAEHAALERELADWLGWPRALVLGSGFAANLAVLQSLLGRDDLCLQDKLNHASLIDGARLAGCALRRYPHGDIETAARLLAAHERGLALLASDGVFSMDGDVAPLRELAALAAREDALLYIDDAHGVGVLGERGRGSVAAAGLGPREVPLLLVTFGKALGGYGAALLGSDALIDHLRQTARPYIYTTATPPALAAAMRANLRAARDDGWRREKLRAHIARFREGAARRGLPLLPSDTPIQPLVLGDNARTLAASAALDAAGFRVAAIRPPSVPEGSARLRITLSAAHAEADIDALLVALAGIVEH
ncbi:MAG: 8-amino-7-oxononanoate synthase [Rehaibacterium terrae]|uniref:8-amino-7-oxononanoate synthase n=1 Tax=Rehaibacterium terrae TaxID=1341696 RepID=UPI00391BDCA8